MLDCPHMTGENNKCTICETVERQAEEILKLKQQLSQKQKPSLKRVLMELGNKLVHEHRYLPAGSRDVEGIQAFHSKGTSMIAMFTDFMNSPNAPELRECLSELGFEWEVNPSSIRSHWSR